MTAAWKWTKAATNNFGRAVCLRMVRAAEAPYPCSLLSERFGLPKGCPELCFCLHFSAFAYICFLVPKHSLQTMSAFLSDLASKTEMGSIPVGRPIFLRRRKMPSVGLAKEDTSSDRSVAGRIPPRTEASLADCFYCLTKCPLS